MTSGKFTGKEVTVGAYYVMLANLTDKGRQAVRRDPDRIKAVNREVEAMGARVVDQYVLLGAYDFLTILEADSNEVMARIAVDLGARGTITPMTMAAFSVDNLIDQLKKKD